MKNIGSLLQSAMDDRNEHLTDHISKVRNLANITSLRGIHFGGGEIHFSMYRIDSDTQFLSRRKLLSYEDKFLALS